ncbi:DUF4363 family protein [Flavonifractor hominis]|uniref:DUF4363 family protein n=1 Tax=Flavonifractor hominis TaxID=3133178 RepID=A0ABV1EKY8_9FIRM
MKRLWVAVLLLGAVFGATLCNTAYLRGFTGELNSLLEQAQRLAEAEDWPRALELTEQALQTWKARDVYLHVLLRHSDTDQIYASFCEVEQYLTCRESGEYSAANARLLTQISLLSEAEQLTLKNVF